MSSIGQGLDLNAKIDPAMFVKKIKQRKVTQDFKLGQTLGKGAYGKVILVKHRETGELRAMKSMKKKLL